MQVRVAVARADAANRLAWWWTGLDMAVDPAVKLAVPRIGRGTGTCQGPGVLGYLDVCRRPAGAGTVHAGVGLCSTHGGSRYERMTGAWMMAHAIAREADVSPMEALLLCVRRAAGMNDYWRSLLADESDSDALLPGGGRYGVVEAYERSTAALARYSKLAVDAGVAAMLVQQAQTDGAAIAAVLNEALESAGLSVESETAVRSALRLALENYGQRQLQVTAG